MLDQNVFLDEDKGMVTQQFQAKCPNLLHHKHECVGPDSAFGLKAGITTCLVMADSAIHELY